MVCLRNICVNTLHKVDSDDDDDDDNNNNLLTEREECSDSFIHSFLYHERDPFIVAFPTLRKANFSFVMSVLPTEQLCQRGRV
jgi:hypothetical protein